MGKLCKGNNPDTNAVAKIVIKDWIRGKIPYFTLPPDEGEDERNKLSKKLNRKSLTDANDKVI